MGKTFLSTPKRGPLLETQSDPDQIIEIRDPEVDVEAIMARVRENTARRRAEGVYQEDLDAIADGGCVGAAEPGHGRAAGMAGGTGKPVIQPHGPRISLAYVTDREPTRIS